MEQWKLSRNSNCHNFSQGGPIKAHNISRRSQLNNESSRDIQMVITFHTEVRFRRIIHREAWNGTTEALKKFKWSKLFTRMSNSGASHIEMLEIEQRKLSRYSNGHNFSLGCPIQAHHISRCSKFNNGSSRDIQMVITFHTEVRFRRTIYRDARNWTTKALKKFEWSKLFTRMSDSSASHIETLEIEQWKLSTYSNGNNYSHGGLIQAHNITRRSSLNNRSSREIQIVITFHREVR